MISHNIPISLPFSSLDIIGSAKSLHILSGGFDTLVRSFKILEPQGRSHSENPMTVPNMFFKSLLPKPSTQA